MQAWTKLSCKNIVQDIRKCDCRPIPISLDHSNRNRMMGHLCWSKEMWRTQFSQNLENEDHKLPYLLHMETVLQNVLRLKIWRFPTTLWGKWRPHCVQRAPIEHMPFTLLKLVKHSAKLCDCCENNTDMTKTVGKIMSTEWPYTNAIIFALWIIIKITILYESEKLFQFFWAFPLVF